MNNQEDPNLSQQLAELRREIRSTRRWVVFIAVVVSILLFFPQLGLLLSNWAVDVFDVVGLYLMDLAGILVAIGIAALVVSHFMRRPVPPQVEESRNQSGGVTP